MAAPLPGAPGGGDADRPGAAAGARGALEVTVAAVPALVALAVWRGADEAFAVAEATTLWLGALAVLAVGAGHVALRRRLPWPAGWLAALVAAHALAWAWATGADGAWALDVVGRAGRHAGTASAAAALVLAAAAAWAWRARPPRRLRAALLVAVVPVGGYALAQAAGADPLAWRVPEAGPEVFSTLGNRTFLAAWCGAVLPLAAWGAVDAASPRWRRAGCGLAGAVALAAAAATGSLQVVPGALAAVAVLLLVAPWPRWRTVAAAAAGAAAAGLLRGPELMASAARSLEGRLEHWRTAASIAAEHPLRGVGPAGFAAHARAHEAPEAAAARDLERGLDSPHNIALELLAAGGWPLLLTGAALAGAVLVAWALAWRRRPWARPALAGVGGAWLSWLASAQVAVDVPVLLALGGALAGAVLGLAAPGALASRPSAAARPVAIAAAALAVAAAVPAVGPLRADLAVAEAAGRGDVEAVAELRRAVDLAGYEPRHAARLGAAHNRLGDRAAALAAYEEAVAADPRAVTALLSLARVAVAAGDDARAGRAYAAAVEAAPHTPSVLAEAGAHWLRRGQAARARDLLQVALAHVEGEPSWWRELASAHEALGDEAAGRAARARAAELER